MKAEAEIEGGGKRTLLVVVSKAGTVVKIVAKGGFEIDSELWREWDVRVASLGRKDGG